MELSERLEWLLLGAAIGFILGYIVRTLREIQEELHEVDEIVTERKRDESGFKRPSLQNVALFLVIGLVAFSAFQSQRSSNTSNETSKTVAAQQITLGSFQDDLQHNETCNSQILFDVVKAITERTTYSSAQADANINLVKAQYHLITKAQDLALTPEEGQALFQAYVAQVKTFLKLAKQTQNKQLQNPYPTPEDLTTCLQSVSK